MKKVYNLLLVILIAFSAVELNAQCSNGTSTLADWAHQAANTPGQLTYPPYPGPGSTGYDGSTWDESASWTTTSCTGEQVTMNTAFIGSVDGDTDGIAGLDYAMVQRFNATSTFTITFNKPVTLSKLVIYDIDNAPSYVDQVAISAKNGTTNTPVNITGNSFVNVSGQTISAVNNTDQGSATIATNQPITELTISFSNSNGNNGDQIIFFQKGMEFCCPVACDAGISAPTLTDGTNFVASTSTFTIPCGSSTADLSTLSASNLPAGTNLTVHSGTPATNANKINPATALGTGTYYVSFYDSTNDCYSPTTQVTVDQETNCCNAGNVAPTVQ